MHTRTLAFLALFMGAFVLFLGNSGGRAATNGQGNTGAPGDNPNNTVCGSCHNAGAFGTGVNISVLDDAGEPVSEYLPEAMYTVRVEVTTSTGAPDGYGFQLTALRAELDVNGPDVATFSSPSANAKISTASSTTNSTDPTRQYAEQAVVAGNPIFQVQWTAPAAGSGPVSFYSCGNAVNGNGMSSGDGASCTSTQLNEMVSSTAATSPSTTDFVWVTNPVRDRQLQFALRSEQPTEVELRLLANDGTSVGREALRLDAGTRTHTLELPANISAGHYLLQLIVEGQSRTRSVLVQ